MINNKEKLRTILRVGISMVCVISLILTSFILGGYYCRDTYAASGQLTAKGDTWQSGNATASVICQRDGRYRIDISGGGYAAGDYYDNLQSIFGSTFGYDEAIGTGQKLERLSKPINGGHMVGEISLKKGDVVTVTRYQSAVPNGGHEQLLWQPLAMGGDALIVAVNGTYALGAGGCSGRNYSMRYDWDTSIRSISSGVYDKFHSVTCIDNAKFSPGSSGYVYLDYRDSRDYWGNKCWGARLKNGHVHYYGNRYFNTYGTIAGAEEAPNGLEGYEEKNRAGTNYINRAIVTLKSQPNDGITPNCKITCIQANSVAEDMYAASVRTASALEQMIDKFTEGIKVDVKVDNRGVESAINSVNSTLKTQKSGTGDRTETITVISGKTFDEYIMGDDSTDGGTEQGITVINNDKTDGYVRVSGTLKGKGNKEVVVGGIKYIFKIVEEPDSSNISAVLN